MTQEGAPRPAGARWLEWGALALLLGAALLVFRPFLRPIAWAAILAFATWPLFRRIEAGLRGRTGWAALLATLLIVVVVVGPALVVGLALAQEAQQVFADLKAWAQAQERAAPAWVRELPLVGPQAADWLDHLLADPAMGRQWVLAQAGPWSRQLAAAAGDLGRNLAGAALALLTLFFLYRHGRVLAGQIERAARRLAGERVRAMFTPMGETVRAVMYGMLLTALAQGALATLGYWMAGLGAPVLLGALTLILSFLPAGAPFVYVPVGLWLLTQGRLLAGVLLLAWGFGVVSTVDNVIRTWFISGATRVPILLVFFGVVGGLLAFGGIGLFLGPVVVSLLLTLWREWAA
jgi:predicted PurR-regulated permease PerM